MNSTFVFLVLGYRTTSTGGGPGITTNEETNMVGLAVVVSLVLLILYLAWRVYRNIKDEERFAFWHLRRKSRRKKIEPDKEQPAERKNDL